MSEKDEVQAELNTGEQQVETEQPEAQNLDVEVSEAEAVSETVAEDAANEGNEGENTEAAQQAQAEREKAIQAYQQALIERNGELYKATIFINILWLALLTKSHLVQNKLADYFKRKKSDDQKDEIAKDNASELGTYTNVIV